MNLELNPRTGRRQALKIGGLSVTLAALAAACGENRTGDDAPGRVGNAPVVTTPPDYEVDDAVLLRTASSLEYTAIAVYELVRDFDVLDGELLDRLVADHQGTADVMVGLTEDIGGVAWTETNPWFMDRVVGPLVESITSGDRSDDDINADLFSMVTALENLAAASHQELASAIGETDARIAHLEAALLEARHASVLAILNSGDSKNYFSPALVGEDVARDERGGIPYYAISSTFGETAQIDLIAGPADENGVRTTFSLQTPSLNSFVYNELEPDA
ncbi:MAG: hypothetical protein ABJH68_06630 [Ilumatobacter sp.]|uniref:hypothetical protein n=1 Tax=Ilumatobacter sp. TaxID=1967498 RepID=UPI003299B1C9